MVTWYPGMSLEDMENKIITKSLEFYGNRERAAHSLKMKLKDFDKKVQIHKEQEEENKKKREAAREKERDFALRSRGIKQAV